MIRFVAERSMFSTTVWRTVMLGRPSCTTVGKPPNLRRLRSGAAPLPGNDARAGGVRAGGGVVGEQGEADGFGGAFGNGLRATMAV